MLEWLGGADALQAAWMIRASVTKVFADPQARTRDLGGALSTSNMTEAIVSAMT
jgi:isocitrate/isopropylmalate dehydrogenase